MNQVRTKFLAALQLCMVALLASFVATPAGAQSYGVANRRDDKIVVPPVPPEIKVDDDNTPFLLGRGVGTQNYSCQPCAAGTQGCPNGVAFVLFTPQANLFNDNGELLITHFSSPNPKEPNTDPTIASEHLVRVSWQHSRDASAVWAKAVGVATVDKTAIAWVKLNVKDTGTQEGPTGGDKLTKTTFIQRINTVGGLAPATCNSAADLGKKAFVPYKADYIFYKKAGGGY